jgi:hypothetical protein
MSSNIKTRVQYFFIKQWTLTKEVGQKYPQKGYNIKTGD